MRYEPSSTLALNLKDIEHRGRIAPSQLEASVVTFLQSQADLIEAFREFAETVQVASEGLQQAIPLSPSLKALQRGFGIFLASEYNPAGDYLRILHHTPHLTGGDGEAIKVKPAENAAALKAAENAAALINTYVATFDLLKTMAAEVTIKEWPREPNAIDGFNKAWVEAAKKLMETQHRSQRIVELSQQTDPSQSGRG